MTRKKITIDDLAAMVQTGFKDTAKQSDMDAGFDAVDKRFDAVDERLDRIEKLILVDHKRRIERLEGEMKDLKDLLAVK